MVGSIEVQEGLQRETVTNTAETRQIEEWNERVIEKITTKDGAILPIDPVTTEEFHRDVRIDVLLTEQEGTRENVQQEDNHLHADGTLPRRHPVVTREDCAPQKNAETDHVVATGNTPLRSDTGQDLHEKNVEILITKKIAIFLQAEMKKNHPEILLHRKFEDP